MYRIFCESYKNFVDSFSEDSVRLQISAPLQLITDTNKYKEEKKKQSEIYKKLSDLLYYMEQNINEFPKIKAFLWTIASRDIAPKKYDITTVEELEEQTKLVNSFLKLAYW